MVRIAATRGEAWCLLKLDRVDEALQRFAAVAAGSEDAQLVAEAQARIGDIQFHRGQYDAAITAYGKVSREEVTQLIEKCSAFADSNELLEKDYLEAKTGPLNVNSLL